MSTSVDRDFAAKVARITTLPSNWRIVPVGEVIAEAQAGFACGERDPVGVIQLRMNNVDTRGRMLWDQFIRVPADPGLAKKYRLLPGDVLFNNTNSVELVGKTALFTGHDERVVYSNHFTRLRVRPDACDPSYLAAWLLHQWNARVFENLCNRWIGQSAVKYDKLSALDFPLPPLAEQRRIAGKLREQMAAVERAKHLVDKQFAVADSMHTAFVRSIFSSAESSDWPLRPLRDLCQGNGQYGTSDKADDDPAGTPVLRMGNIIGGRLDWSNLRYIKLPPAEESKYALTRGDVLFNRTNSAELVGKTAVFDEDRRAVFASYLIRFRINETLADPYFIAAFINSSAGRTFVSANMGRAIGQVNISASIMHTLLVPCPPLQEQKQLMATVREKTSHIDRLLCGIEGTRDSIESLPTALLREAFAGRL